jgi:hypothetical protein
LLVKHENHDITYSITETKHLWLETIAEDVEVTIQIKSYPTKEKEFLEKNNGYKLDPNFPVCKSSWIGHLIKTDNQMDNSVRDYIVPCERISSLLKEHKF